MLQMPSSQRSPAEDCFRTGLNLAIRQSAKLWELRVATALSRLWRNQGKRSEAYELLAPICAWFTEGLDSPDLKEANLLLEELVH